MTEASKKPRRLLAKSRAKVSPDASKRNKKKQPIVSSDSGEKKSNRVNQPNQKKMVIIKVGKKLCPRRFTI